jgi:hypothetical protein
LIASLAGRRIDAAGADPERFPADLENVVAGRIATTLTGLRVTALVCAAACGADLLALDAAQESGIEAHIVLPYAIDDFRRSSVTDRGADWGEDFDRLVGAAQARGHVHILGLHVRDPDAYEKTNEAILDEALALAGHDAARVVALAVWDGASAGRPGADYTAAFTNAARARGIAVRSIPILE